MPALALSGPFHAEMRWHDGSILTAVLQIERGCAMRATFEWMLLVMITPDFLFPRKNKLSLRQISTIIKLGYELAS